jgi:hypothetical protein
MVEIANNDTQFDQNQTMLIVLTAWSEVSLSQFRSYGNTLIWISTAW